MLLTCVSCYFQVNNKHHNLECFSKWFKNTLSINCPYVFFTNKNTIELIKNFRKDLPTYYIECEIEDFTTYKYKDQIITDYNHCPSIELNLIWLEKIFMIQKASQINPFNSEWFKWIDAGLCIYRDESPPKKIFPNNDKLNTLPKDKFIFSSTDAPREYYEEYVKKDAYYHYIAGTSFILHQNFIEQYVNIYNSYLDKLIDKNNLWTEQVIFTHIYKDHKELYYKLCKGYGEITRYLYNE